MSYLLIKLNFVSFETKTFNNVKSINHLIAYYNITEYSIHSYMYAYFNEDQLHESYHIAFDTIS